MQQFLNDGEATSDGGVKSRREFFSKVAAAASAAPILLTSTQAQAVTNEPTRIELNVDTEYLIRVLNYFDGDMRKVLGAIVRSPQTTVEIEPPLRGQDPSLSPKDAILRSLYSYNSPDDYVTQASWLKVDEPDRLKEFLGFLTKRRYRLYLPSVVGGNDGESTIDIEMQGDTISYKKMEVSIRPTNLNLSNLEVAFGLGLISYPLAYSYYNYESYQEEQNAKLKKAKMAAKKAAKAKAAAAKKSKGTPKKKASESVGDDVKTDATKKQPPAMKGQEMKKDSVDKKTTLPTKKATTVKQTPEDIAEEAMATIEDIVAADMLDSKREEFIAATKVIEQQAINELEQLDTAAASGADDVIENIVAADMLDSKREEFIAATKVIEQQADNELEQLVTAAASGAADVQPSSSESPQSVPASIAGGGGYLDSLNKVTAIPARGSVGERYAIDEQPTAKNEESMVESSGSSNMGASSKRGPSNNYLDSL